MIDKYLKYIICCLCLIFIIIISYCHIGNSVSQMCDEKDQPNPINASIVFPSNNSIMNDDFSLKGIAFSSNEIVKIIIYLDGKLLGYGNLESTWEGPYDANGIIQKIDVNSLEQGRHNLTVTFIDGKNYEKTETIFFIIQNNLSLSITSPQNNQLLPNSTSISVAGKCNGFYKPFRKIEVWIDNDLSTISEAIINYSDLSWTANISSINLAKGNHLVSARLYDNNGLSLAEANIIDTYINIYIINEQIGIRIFSPDNMTSVMGNVRIGGYAYSISSKLTVEIKIDDGNWSYVSDSNYWNYIWDTHNFTIGIHEIKARVTDFSKLMAEDSIILKISPLTIKIIEPIDGSKIGRAGCPISGTCFYSHSIQKIDLFFDGIYGMSLPIFNNTYWTTELSSTNIKFPNQLNYGYHVITALAKDSLGNITQDSVIVNASICQNMAVITGNYDHIQDVLYELNYGANVTLVNEDILLSSTALDNYCRLFINCRETCFWANSQIAIDNLRNFVSIGNSLYASDWAYGYISNPFPGKINFLDPYPRIGPSTTLTCNVTDLNLSSVVGSDVLIHFNLPYWALIQSISPSAQLYVKGDIPIYGTVYAETPLLASFKHGSGNVVYTSFHNEANITVDMENVLKFIIEHVML